MRRLLMGLMALMVIGAAAGCAGPGAAQPEPPAAPGIPLVPHAGGGVELRIFEVTHLQMGSGRFNHLVSFELANKEHDQLEITRESLRLVGGDGQEFPPNLINPHDPADSPLVARGATASFSAGFNTPVEGRYVLRYVPAAGAEPLIVAIDGTSADPQSRFYGLKLAPVAESSFSAPFAAEVRSTYLKNTVGAVFTEPASYVKADISHSGAELGWITVELYDDLRYPPFKFDVAEQFFGTDERHRIAGFDQLPLSVYHKARHTNGTWFVKGGFVQCHAVVDLVLTSAREELLPGEAPVVEALDRLRGQLEPLACP